MQIYKWLHGLPQDLFQRNALLSALCSLLCARVCAIFVVIIAVERVHCNLIFKSINVRISFVVDVEAVLTN